MVKIRKYRASDRKAVQNVCLDTSVGRNADSFLTRYILALYCNYYIETEPENCFVAVDENDVPIGYCICSSDYDKFEREFMKNYMPRISGCGLKYVIYTKGEIAAHRMFRKDFPAHLHIDIIDEYQRQGIGRRLLDALFEHLEENNVSGLALICNTNNKGAVKFYEKYGFTLLMRFNAIIEDFSIYGYVI